MGARRRDGKEGITDGKRKTFFHRCWANAQHGSRSVTHQFTASGASGTKMSKLFQLQTSRVSERPSVYHYVFQSISVRPSWSRLWWYRSVSVDRQLLHIHTADVMWWRSAHRYVIWRRTCSNCIECSWPSGPSFEQRLLVSYKISVVVRRRLTQPHRLSNICSCHDRRV